MADLKSLGTWSLGALTLAGFGSGAAAQTWFVNSSANIPATGSYTENVDFADVDHDGDWDAVLADGGDQGNDQDRFYLNNGGLQLGTVGTYTDDTAARFPVSSHDGRDIEFLDWNADGDVDIYTSNTSNFTNQSNEFWKNTGGADGGTLGFYVNETSTRWVGLGGVGSSIAAGGVLPSGGFIDWSCDCDFSDLDNDGDIDLFHSTYGGAFGGQVPSRIFLNNGQGFFSEFNPSGFKLTGSDIVVGNPGIWCAGTQATNTANMTGTNCDVASSALDLDLGDFDGDFDMDVLHGARQENARIFLNRLAETGSLAFRDVTGASAGGGAWPAGYTTGSDNYEQEDGDMDNDGDLDIYGLNYPGLNDAVFNNISTAGNLVWNNMQVLGGSGADDNEGDFADYDNDGDLEIYVAAFASTNKVYRNNYAGGGPGAYTYTNMTGVGAGQSGDRSLDSDTADVDNDGDYDQMCAEDANKNEVLRTDVLAGAADTQAARIPNTETLGNNTAAAGFRIARAQVYDNGNYYTTWYNTTRVEVTVDGCKLPNISAQSSNGGNVFRSRIPANLDGAVGYQWKSTDEHGNTGSSTVKNYTGSTGLAYETHYGAASAGSIGVPTLDSLSVPFINSTYYAAMKNVAAGKTVYIYVNSASLLPGPGGSYIPGLGQINIGGLTFLRKAGAADASNCFVGAFDVPNSPSLVGGKVYVQGLALDGVAGDLLATTDGIELTVQ